MRKLILTLILFMIVGTAFVPNALAAGTLAGTTISNQAYGDYKDANGNDMSRVYSNTVTVTVSQVAAVSTSPETEAHNGVLGTNVIHPVTICNEGNSNDTFTLAATPPAGWTMTIYKDDNSDGIWQSATETTVVSNTGALAADTCFKVIAVVAVPSSGPVTGASYDTTFTATSTFNGAVSDSSTLKITVQAAVMTLNKTVSSATPKPGDIITYAIEGNNTNADAPAYNVRAIDQIPANTTYVANSMKAGPVGGTYADAYALTDANDAQNLAYGDAIANGWFNSGANELQLDWSQCQPAGVFYFQVQVNADVPQGTIISNSMTATYSLSGPDDYTRPYTETSNSATSTVDYYPGVLLSPDRTGSGNPSDKIQYAFSATNTGNASDTIDLTYTSSLGWTWVIWRDVDGDGLPGTDGDYILTDTDADGKIDTNDLPQGDSLALLAVATIPAGTTDASVDTTVITGASSIDTATTSSVTMTTTVKAPLLSVTKALTSVQAPASMGGAVCVPTDTSTGAGCSYYPGSVLTYQVTTTNNGTGTATSVIITDLVPSYTTYKAGSIRTGASAGSLASRSDAFDGDGARYEGGAVIVGGGANLSIGGSGTWVAEFQVTVD
jgi:uncharacterized repeat protein (TIGR01451 family)